MIAALAPVACIVVAAVIVTLAVHRPRRETVGPQRIRVYPPRIEATREPDWLADQPADALSDYDVDVRFWQLADGAA